MVQFDDPFRIRNRKARQHGQAVISSTRRGSSWKDNIFVIHLVSCLAPQSSAFQSLIFRSQGILLLPVPEPDPGRTKIDGWFYIQLIVALKFELEHEQGVSRFRFCVVDLAEGFSDRFALSALSGEPAGAFLQKPDSLLRWVLRSL